MQISRLVLGTNNPAKVKEWKEFLDGIVEVVGISDMGSFPEAKESGKTFEENARIKARHYAKLTREYVLSEDGGYEVNALNGAPGVKSRRILPGDKDGTDEELIEFVLTKLKSVPTEKRTVNLTTAVAIADPKGKIVYEDKESFKGIVSEKPGPVRIAGYPFRTIHFIPELGKTYAELTQREHMKFNHKRKIAERFKKFLAIFLI